MAPSGWDAMYACSRRDIAIDEGHGADNGSITDGHAHLNYRVRTDIDAIAYSCWLMFRFSFSHTRRPFDGVVRVNADPRRNRTVIANLQSARAVENDIWSN